jgi:hypothetical protein
VFQTPHEYQAWPKHLTNPTHPSVLDQLQANGGLIWLLLDCSVSTSNLISANSSKFDQSDQAQPLPGVALSYQQWLTSPACQLKPVSISLTTKTTQVTQGSLPRPLCLFLLSKPNVTILVLEVQTRSKTSSSLMVLTINAINLNFLDSYGRLMLHER